MTFYVKYLNNRGKTRWYRLGNPQDLTLPQIRSLADKIRNQLALGIDPADEKATQKSTPNFGDFIADQYLPYVKTYKRSWETDVSILKNHLLPRFTKKYLDEISRADITKLLNERVAEGAKPGTVNRSLIMMRYIFNLAVRWDVPGIKANPTKGVPLIEENNKRERYLSVEEAQKLYGAVCSSENTMLKFIVPMLILTGARKREVLDARWEDFDLARRVWRIPITKSGKARRVPLSDGALTLLATMPRKSDCPWAFANPATDKPYVSFFCAWDTARKKVGLQDVCVHSLRHSHASFLINAGRTLYEVQNILGHTQVKTTQRYAHLSHDTLLDATNSVNTTLAGMFVPMVSASPTTSLHIC
jgi:integrase